MNKFTKWFAIPMLCLATNFANAANIKDYPTVAVMEFGNKAITSRGLRGHDMAMATEYAIYQLSNCGWFDLIDYEQLSTIAKMHSINMSGLVDQGTAVQMGKVLGAQFMVIGNVTGLTAKENVAGIRAHNAKLGNAQHVVNANVAVRIVDIETGRIVAAGIGKGSSTSTMTEIGFTKFRNRKIEAENIYNSVANHIVDEYSKNNVVETDESTSLVTDERNIKDNINKFDTKQYKERKDSNFSEREIIGVDYSKEKVSEELVVGTSSESGEKVTDTYSMGAQKDNFKFIAGDVNEDRVINELDLKLLKRYLMDLSLGDRFTNYEKFEVTRADLNGDGIVNVSDAKVLRDIVYGLQMRSYKHIKGDIDSYEAYGWVDENDLRMLKDYLVGYKDEAMNIIEADLNDDGTINQTDLSILRQIVENEERNQIMYDYHRRVPQVYWDYNNAYRNGESTQKDMSPSLEKVGSVVENNVSNKDYDVKKAHNANTVIEMDMNKERTGIKSETNSRDLLSSSAYNREVNDKKNIETIYDKNNSYSNVNVNTANNVDTFSSSNKNIYYEREAEEYSIVIGTAVVSDVQVRNAISKAVRDAIYGKTGIMTTLNNGKQLKIKTGF